MSWNTGESPADLQGIEPAIPPRKNGGVVAGDAQHAEEALKKMRGQQ